MDHDGIKAKIDKIMAGRHLPSDLASLELLSLILEQLGEIHQTLVEQSGGKKEDDGLIRSKVTY